MATLFALMAAVAWGTSDFAAGYASRRAPAVSVVVLTHLASAVALGLVVLSPFVGDTVVTGRDLLWGLGSGLGGGAGAMLLFRGLSRGSMATVAPITAAGAAIIPAVAGIGLGESLSTQKVGGIVLALVAIVMISLSDGAAPDAVNDDDIAGRPPLSGPDTTVATAVRPTVRARRIVDRPGVLDALGSGVGFGLFFVCISRTGEDAGYWPLLAARLASVAIFVVIARRAAHAVLPPIGSRRPVVLAGVLDAAAAVFFVLSTRTGLLSVGAVLASLYPAATIVLARVIADERVGRRQLAGLALAAVAVGILAI